MAKNRSRGFAPTANRAGTVDPPFFDISWIRHLRDAEPDLWACGGKEGAYLEFERQYANPSPEWLALRRAKWESCRDYNTPAGYLHLLRWGLIADAGEQAMRSAIDGLRGLSADARNAQLRPIVRQGNGTLRMLGNDWLRSAPGVTQDDLENMFDQYLDSRQYRAAETGDIDEEKRTVTMSFSSENPVERGYWYTWYEVLGHDPGEYDFTRLNDGGAYLWAHDPKDQRGVVEKAWIEEHRGLCTARLSENPLGEELWIDIKTGIKKNVSFAYWIHEEILVKTGDDGDWYRATNWEALEVSSVSIPADPSIGVGRSFRSASLTSPPLSSVPVQVSIKEVRNMADLSNDSANQANQEELLRRERERIDLVTQLGQRFDMPSETVRDFIQRGLSLEQAFAEFQRSRPEPAVIRSNAVVDLSQKERRQYSLSRLMLAVCTGDRSRAGFEFEVSDEMSRLNGLRTGGAFVPTNIGLFGQRAQTVANPAQGGNLVATDYLGNEFIDLLRNTALTPLLGMSVLNGLVGPVAIPRKTTGGGAGWIAEGQAIPGTEIGIGLLGMRPKKLAALYDFTHELANQSSPDIEQLLGQDIAEVFALAWDRTVYYGSGVGEEPRGIASTPGILPVVMGADGDFPSWAKVVEHESRVNTNNALGNRSAYVTNATILGLLKTTPKGDNTAGIFLVGDGMVEGNFSTLNGRRLGVSNQIRSDRAKGARTGLSDMFFGDFGQVIGGVWSGIEITKSDSHADTFARDVFTIKATMFADLGVRQPTAFSFCSDLRSV